MYQGASREKALDEVAEGSNSIMITGKTLITRESDFTRFKDIEWKAIFVDEYHEYKNPKSQAHQCVLQLRDEFQCPIVGLTGTLMQVRPSIEMFHFSCVHKHVVNNLYLHTYRRITTMNCMH